MEPLRTGPQSQMWVPDGFQGQTRNTPRMFAMPAQRMPPEPAGYQTYQPEYVYQSADHPSMPAAPRMMQVPRNYYHDQPVFIVSPQPGNYMGSNVEGPQMFPVMSGAYGAHMTGATAHPAPVHQGGMSRFQSSPVHIVSDDRRQSPETVQTFNRHAGQADLDQQDVEQPVSRPPQAPDVLEVEEEGGSGKKKEPASRIRTRRRRRRGRDVSLSPSRSRSRERLRRYSSGSTTTLTSLGDSEDEDHDPLKTTVKRKAQFPHRDRRGVLRTIVRPDTFSETLVPGAVLSSEPGSASVTITREFDEEGTVARYTLDVDSWAFLELLREAGKYLMSDNGISGRKTFREPFADLYSRRDAMKEWLRTVDRTSQDPRIGQKVSCTECVLRILEADFPAISQIFDLYTGLSPPDKVDFANLWMLYRPGTMLFGKSKGVIVKDRYEEDQAAKSTIEQPFALMIDWVEYEKAQPAYTGDLIIESSLTVFCWSLDTNGDELVRQGYSITIAPYEGDKAISSLEYVPERFASESVKAALKARGKIFWGLQGPSYREVVKSDKSGQGKEENDRVMVDRVLFDRSGADDRQYIVREREREPVIIERERTRTRRYDDYYNPPPPPRRTYVEEDDVRIDRRRGRDIPGIRRSMDFSTTWFTEFDSIDRKSEPTDTMLLLCPPTVKAFSLRNKAWSDYNIAELREVVFMQDAFDRLVLDKEYKDVVRAMVKSYLTKSDNFHDLVPGKGGGVVILLHGPPGVGKTLTAECVAETFHKPLYMVTAGDLGTDSGTLESKLAKIFDYAMRWDAILLLDEADVFLQDRDYENLERNALVSIFLRTLEYFNGIMFLTSNRVGAFDQAFQSRIHITLGIPEFDRVVRKAVWKIFITDLGRKRADGSDPLLTIDECKALGREVLNSWALEPLNGRQIRNCVRSALALAQDKGEKPGAHHFNTVIQLGNMFTQYMQKLQKQQSDQLAQVKGDRLAEMRSLIVGAGKATINGEVKDDGIA